MRSPRLILNRLQQKAAVTDEELQQLHQQIADLEARAAQHRHATHVESDPVDAARPAEMIDGHATSRDITEFITATAEHTCPGFYAAARDLLISNVGIGTYRGANTGEIDSAYADSIHTALRMGINLIDTSLNYRRQRSERMVAAGLRRFIARNGGRREQVVVCTKAGYVLPEALTAGILGADDVVGGSHSIAPAFVADQIDRSRRNLGLGTIDVYYLHNPETQLRFITMPEFMNRIRAAFERLERAVSDGLIRYFGTATWAGYRDGTLSLRAMAEAAHDIAGDAHHFRFVQLPFNLRMQEARDSVLDVAKELGITVIASATLSRDLPGEIAREMPGLTTDAQRALQFARSTPGIACALAGMSDTAHVTENLAVARVPPLTPAAYQRLCAAISGLFAGTI